MTSNRDLHRFEEKRDGLITCISCLPRIAHITLETIIVRGKGSEPYNAYNMLNTQNTYYTQHKVSLRRRVLLIKCITCIIRISRITLRTMIAGKRV